MRYRLSAVLLFLAAAVQPAAAEPVAVKAVPVPLNAEAPEQQSVDLLRFRGGVALTSPDRRFADLSGLWVDGEGGRFAAVSDRGFLVTGRLLHDADGRLQGVVGVDIAPLMGPDGRPLLKKLDADAEELTPDGAGGLIMAFERRHRLWHYPAGGGLPEEVPPPPGLFLAPANDGIEAMARLGDGRLLVITEGFQVAHGSGPHLSRGGVAGWIGSPGAWEGFTYATDGGFAPTGATLLPDGDVGLVERRYSVFGGVAVRILRLPVASLRLGERVEPGRLADLVAPLTVDNFEGIAARRGPEGKTLLYLISDDNHNPRQRTLLLSFEISG